MVMSGRPHHGLGRVTTVRKFVKFSPTRMAKKVLFRRKLPKILQISGVEITTGSGEIRTNSNFSRLKICNFFLTNNKIYIFSPYCRK